MRPLDVQAPDRRLRVLWLSLLGDLLAMTALAVGLPIVFPARFPVVWLAFPTWAEAGFSLAFGLLIPLAYFVRMSIFKRHWVGQQITQPGYVNGQRSAMLLIWLSGFLFIVMAMLTARHALATLGTILAMIVLSINRPKRWRA